MIDKSIAKSWLEKSHLLRILLLCFLVLLLQIPISMIESMIYERTSRQTMAVSEVSEKWGRQQEISGPMLIIPYQYKEKKYKNGVVKYETPIKKYATFLPEILQINGELKHDTRSRGIFKVPLYQVNVHLEGTFHKPDFSIWNVSKKDILWKEAKLVIGVSDARAIQKQVFVNWQGESLPVRPGTDNNSIVNTGFHTPIETSFNQRSFNFSIKLNLNGSQSIRIVPLGKDSDISLSSDWPDPSFQGNWLPLKRDVTENGFKAHWKIPYLGRNFPQQWNEQSGFADKVKTSTIGVDLLTPIDSSYRMSERSVKYETLADKVKTTSIGVDFLTPVDSYRMSERSVKYETLFLLLTFTAIWLFELICKVRVHPVQYLFIGAAICLFYFLELSLSEHIGFLMAYIIASIAIVCMVSSYAYVILKTGRRASIIGGGISLLYVYLYVLLQEQNFALLIGSIGLFIVLGSVMYLTRNIDWYGGGTEAKAIDNK